MKCAWCGESIHKFKMNDSGKQTWVVGLGRGSRSSWCYDSPSGVHRPPLKEASLKR